MNNLPTTHNRNWVSDFDPFRNMTVGFDNIFDQLSALSHFETPNYPPYNIKKVDKENAVFFPLEELIVNLNAGGRKSTFLKIRISLELADGEDISRIESVMPRIMDNFQVYLRELRIEDLKGSAGMYRLREELLTRVNAAAAPAKIRDVLFKEILVQ